MRRTLADELRKQIDRSGLSINELAAECGITQSKLHRFYVDGADMRLSAADKLAAYFKLRLTRRKG